MGTYRSPAVALMPDVTPKPLRSKANAIINLMGAIGGIIYLLVTSVLYSKSRTDGLEHVDYMPLFAIVGGIMLVALFVIMFLVNEPKLAREQREYEKAHPEDNLTVSNKNNKEVMPKAVKKSLAFLLISVSLWFIGYNAVKTWFSTYALEMWGMPAGDSSKCLLIATVAAVISYIPVGMLASKIGRKLTILIGVGLLTASFAAADRIAAL
jgi:Na+/melibiose symporter-like transporter